MTIGAIIKQYREVHDMTQAALASKSGLTQALISKAEQTPGYLPKVTNLSKFAKGMDMSVDELVREIERTK